MQLEMVELCKQNASQREALILVYELYHLHKEGARERKERRGSMPPRKTQ
jgi:hypothetical protein